MAHLFIIAGHGAGDSGAVGYGYTEAERVRALARRIVALGGSNVTLGDVSRNWYADKGISSLNIPKSYQILELHMDSGIATAKGGHVIIKAGYSPDQYDTALANFIGSFFPGRANKVVGRAHLANVNRAAAKGYSYRLLENGFITNKTDLTKFNEKIDDLARGILKSFCIAPAAPVAPVKKKAEPIDGEIKAGGVFQSKTDKFGTISYQAHMRSAGWGAWQSDGLMVGSTNQNRRIEALHIQPVGETDVVVHMKGIGNKEYKNITKDTLIGTTGQNRRLEAIRYCMEKLKAYDPTGVILVCLPPQRAEGNENQEKVNEVIKSIVESYSVKTKDFYHESGIVPNTKIEGIGYLTDGLHLDVNGYTVLGNSLASEVAYMLII